MPVAVSPIDGKVGTLHGQFGLECRDELAILIVNGTFAAEVVVMFGDFEHALAGDIFSAQDVFKKWHYIVGPFGATEGRNEDCVILHALAYRSAFIFACSFPSCQSARKAESGS